MRRPSTAAIQAALIVRRIADQKGLDVRFTEAMGRVLGDARVVGRIDGSQVAQDSLAFAPEDCPDCGAPTNNASGRPCTGCAALR